METVPPSADSWAVAKASLRAADPRMASLVDADPTLDPGTVLDGWPTALWDALVFNVVGQQLSVAATRAILARLRALHDGRPPTPAELLATDTENLRGPRGCRTTVRQFHAAHGASAFLVRRPCTCAISRNA